MQPNANMSPEARNDYGVRYVMCFNIIWCHVVWRDGISDNGHRIWRKEGRLWTLLSLWRHNQTQLNTRPKWPMNWIWIPYPSERIHIKKRWICGHWWCNLHACQSGFWKIGTGRGNRIINSISTYAFVFTAPWIANIMMDRSFHCAQKHPHVHRNIPLTKLGSVW